jgi:hypothetical protein
MNVLKPHVSLKGNAATMHDDAQKTSAAYCTPASLGGSQPVQIGKKSGCC